jgi:hypothetical protein
LFAYTVTWSGLSRPYRQISGFISGIGVPSSRSHFNSHIAFPRATFSTAAGLIPCQSASLNAIA